MASRNRRARVTGRYESGRTYACLFEDLLTSEASRALPHFARSVFAAMAARYRGGNNGDISMTARMAAGFGITPAELSAAIPLLESSGLIERMRQGRFAGGKVLCTLWALTCWPIDASEKYDVPLKVQMPAPNTWAKWTAPPDWRAICRRAWRRAKGRKFPYPQRGEQAAPHGGNGQRRIHSPRGEQGNGNSAPHGGDTSDYLGVTLHAQVCRFIDLHPQKSDVDVAVAFRWKLNQLDVARIRQTMEPGIGGVASDATGH